MTQQRREKDNVSIVRLYLFLGAMAIHVQLEIFFVSKALATYFTAQVFDRFKV